MDLLLQKVEHDLQEDWKTNFLFNQLGQDVMSGDLGIQKASSLKTSFNLIMKKLFVGKPTT